MKIHRFFVETKLPQRGVVKIKETELVHQWRNVLRFQVGQELMLFDNSGDEFRGVVSLLTNQHAEIEIVESRTVEAPPIKPTLCLALAKRDSFEWTLEKATELGVVGIIPFVSERSEKKSVRLDRSKSILKEASEQSGRATLPTISEPVSLAEALDSISTGGTVSVGRAFALHPEGKPFTDFLSSINKGANESIFVFIGPEGGFSPKEIALFQERHIPIYSLGRQVLRAETAAVAVTSLLVYAQ